MALRSLVSRVVGGNTLKSVAKVQISSWGGVLSIKYMYLFCKLFVTGDRVEVVLYSYISCVPTTREFGLLQIVI